MSSKNRPVPQRSDELWSRLQTVWLEIPHRRAPEPYLGGLLRTLRSLLSASLLLREPTCEDRERFARIVVEVLAGKLELFIGQCSELEELKRLKASADRLLALGESTGLGTDTFSSAGEHNVNAAQFDEQR